MCAAGINRELGLVFVKMLVFWFQQHKSWVDQFSINSLFCRLKCSCVLEWADLGHESKTGGPPGLSITKKCFLSYPGALLSSNEGCSVISKLLLCFEAGNSVRSFLFLMFWFTCRAGGCFHQLLNQLQKKPRKSWAFKKKKNFLWEM